MDVGSQGFFDDVDRVVSAEFQRAVCLHRDYAPHSRRGTVGVAHGQ